VDLRAALGHGVKGLAIMTDPVGARYCIGWSKRILLAKGEIILVDNCWVAHGAVGGDFERVFIQSVRSPFKNGQAFS